MRILLIGLLVTGFLFNASGQEALSLEDCINYALESNQQIEIARLESDIAETQIKETLSRGLPQINADVNVVNNTRVPLSPIPGEVVGQPDQDFILVAFQTQYSSQPTISARQMLFDGSFFVGLEASRTLRELRTKESERTERDIVEAVSKAYYAVLINEANLVQLSENSDRLDTLLYETQALYENGFAERIDVNRIKIQQNNLKTNLSNTRDLLSISLSLLKFQMGMPIDQPIILSEKLNADFEPMILTGTADDFDYGNRVEYQILQTNLNLTKLDAKNNKVQRIPSLYLNYNLGWNAFSDNASDLLKFSEDDPFPIYNRFSNIGVSLSLPLFDGFRKKSLIQRAEIQGKQIRSTMKMTENQIDLEVKQATIAYNNALRDLETQEENTELAREVYDVSRVKYEEGIGANLEVIEADNDYKQAQTNYLNALYEAITSQIELKKALGTLYKN